MKFKNNWDDNDKIKHPIKVKKGGRKTYFYKD